MAIQGASKTSCRAAYEKFGSGDLSHAEARRRGVDAPFELPQGWAWARLGEVGSWKAGATPSRKVADYYVGGVIPWLKTGDLNDGVVTYIPESITEKAIAETSVRLNPVGTVLIAMYGATIGRTGLLGIAATTNQACCACIVERQIYNRYLFYYLMAQSEHFRSLGGGGAQPNISKDIITSYPFPVPPLAEQRRIVAKIDELFSIVDSMGNAADGLSSVAKRLDKKILDLAIRGRLVPQDPNDEPASELVKRIAASHKSPCKKQSELIHPPFAIPQSWEWVRLGAICEILDSKRKPVAKSKRKPGPYPYYGATCIQDFVSDFIFDEPLVLLGEDGAKWGKGDKSAFCVDGKIWVNNHAHVLRPCDGINHIYLVCTLDILDLMPYVTGTTVPKLNQEKMCDIQIPLPPLAEQKRIVAKIEELRAVIKPLTM